MNQLLILTVYSFHFVRYGVLFPLIPLYAESLGAGSAVIGITVGAFSLVAVFFSIPLGGLTDRFGVKRLLLLGVICNICNAGVLLAADSVAAVFIAQTIAGIGFLLHVVACQAYFSRLPRAADREKGFGYISFAAAVGQGLGPLLGGFVAARYGYPAAFAVVLGLSLVGLLVLGVKDTAEVRAVKSTYSLTGDFRLVRELSRSAGVRTVLLFAFVVIFAVSLRNSFLPVFLKYHGLGEAGVGFLIALFAAASTSIRLFFGFIMDRLSRRNVTALAVSAVVLGVGLIPVMPSPVGYAAALVVFGLGFGLSQPLSMVMMSDLAAARDGGLAMGLRFTAIMAANLTGPVLLGLLAEVAALPFVFYAAAGLVGLFGLAAVGLHPELLPQRREENAVP